MKKTYQELEKEIEALRTTNNLIENSSVIRIIWKAFSEWRVEFVTENIKDVFGYSAKEFLTASVKYSDIIHKDDFQTIKGEILDKGSDGSSFIEHKPYRIIAKDGSVKWLKDITSIHRNNGGEITHYEGIIIDITEQVEAEEAEEAISDNELRWQFAIEGNSDGLWDWNILTDEVYYSSQWKKMLGFSGDEIKGDLYEWDSRVHPDDKQKALEDINRHLRGETDFYENEHRLLCKDNTYKWILDRGKVITFSKDNKPIRIIGTLSDITKRKKAEQDLRDNEKKFRTLVDNMSDLVFMVDSDMRIITINETARTLVNRKIEDIVGKRVSDLFPARISKDYIEKLREAFVIKKQIKADSELEIGITKLYISTELNPIFDKKGKMIAVMGVSRDITERKVAEQTLLKSEARLIESNKTKDKFFAIIAHDLRSPFNSMLGFSDLLYNNFYEYNIEKQKKMIDILHNSINSTYKLLDNLLLWSQSQRGIIELSKEQFNLKQLFIDTTNLLQQSVDDKDITLAVTIPVEINIVVDKQMFATIIRNLITNAIKYTPRNGLIDVNAAIQIENKEEYIEVSVSDNGVGITSEVQTKLFDINESISTKGTENESGTGLGLVLCKDFVEMHNGKIWVESEIGKGSLFTFTIPSKLISLTENEENVVEKKDHFVFLVAEDEEINFMFLKILLSNHKLDIEIIRAVNGEDAVDICKNNSDICFVLMDLKMPVMDGFEATSLIKKFRPDLPIIAQSAYTTKKDKQKADLAGCDSFISKPISKKALKGVIDRFLVI